MAIDQAHIKRLLRRREILMGALKDSVQVSFARIQKEQNNLKEFGDTTYREAQIEMGLLIGLWFHLCNTTVDRKHLSEVWANKEKRAEYLNQYLSSLSQYFHVLMDVDFNLIDLGVHNTDNFSVH